MTFDDYKIQVDYGSIPFPHMRDDDSSVPYNDGGLEVVEYLHVAVFLF